MAIKEFYPLFFLSLQKWLLSVKYIMIRVKPLYIYQVICVWNVWLVIQELLILFMRIGMAERMDTHSSKPTSKLSLHWIMSDICRRREAERRGEERRGEEWSPSWLNIDNSTSAPHLITFHFFVCNCLCMQLMISALRTGPIKRVYLTMRWEEWIPRVILGWLSIPSHLNMASLSLPLSATGVERALLYSRGD